MLRSTCQRGSRWIVLYSVIYSVIYDTAMFKLPLMGHAVVWVPGHVFNKRQVVLSTFLSATTS